MKPKVYLAGPIAGGSFEQGDSWRTYAKEVLARRSINGYSPLRGKEFLRAHGQLHSGSYAENPLSTARGITTRDRWDCCTADLVIANLLDADRISIGTMIELGWADAFRVPIILVMEEPVLGPIATHNRHDHAMVRELAGYIVPTLDQALEIACAILLP